MFMLYRNILIFFLSSQNTQIKSFLSWFFFNINTYIPKVKASSIQAMMNLDDSTLLTHQESCQLASALR